MRIRRFSQLAGSLTDKKFLEISFEHQCCLYDVKRSKVEVTSTDYQYHEVSVE